MADYNTLNDMLNTDSEIDDIMANYHSVNSYYVLELYIVSMFCF